MSPNETTATIAIRLDVKLKRRVEKAAELAGLSVTRFVTNTLSDAVAASCPTCSRAAVTAVPAALAPNFEVFLSEVRQNLAIPIVVMTVEGGLPKSYWVRLSEGRQIRTPGSGILSVAVYDPATGAEGRAFQIPRAHIVGWDFDQLGEKHKVNLARGWVDGANKPSR